MSEEAMTNLPALAKAWVDAHYDHWKNASRWGDNSQSRKKMTDAEAAFLQAVDVIERPHRKGNRMTPEQAEQRAREMLAKEYEVGSGEGPYPTYAKLARNGEGAFTQCSIRAVAKALLASAG